MIDIAMTVVGVDEDELFYFKNKPAVDGIGASLRSTSGLEMGDVAGL